MSRPRQIAAIFAADDSRFFLKLDDELPNGGLPDDPLDKRLRALALGDVATRIERALASGGGDFNQALSAVLHELFSAGLVWSTWQARSDVARWMRSCFDRDHELAQLIDRLVEDRDQLEAELREVRARVAVLESKGNVDAV